MWPFRRKAGKHELGAAVTAIPSVVTHARPVPPQAPQAAAQAAPAPVAAPLPVPPAPQAAAAPVPAPPVAEAAPAPPVAPAPVVEAPAPVVPESPEPRVELGFRDGSTAALAPGSDQARALTEIASVLTRKD